MSVGDSIDTLRATDAVEAHHESLFRRDFGVSRSATAAALHTIVVKCETRGESSFVFICFAGKYNGSVILIILLLMELLVVPLKLLANMSSCTRSDFKLLCSWKLVKSISSGLRDFVTDYLAL